MGVRFAPSPTGAFHVGNFRTAWISWLWARKLGKPWVVRMEDIDAPRVRPGAREHQLEELGKLGLRPNQLIIQSERAPRHRQAFLDGLSSGIYPCFCSRKELAAASSAPHGATPVYNGRCRTLSPKQALDESRKSQLPTVAWRLHSGGAASEATADDVLIGRTGPGLDDQGRPLDGATFVPSYHWACAIDDLDGGYELLVRAHDLVAATDIQRGIQLWLASRESTPYSPSAVFHCSLVVSNEGHRLEKRTQGVRLTDLEASGLTIEGLLAKFAASIDLGLYSFEPGKIFGEEKEKLPLGELGL